MFRVYSYTWSTYTNQLNFAKERQQSQLYTKMKNNLNGRIGKFFIVSLPNQLMWNFMFWTGLHRTIEYSMMIIGHARFEPDWPFGIWKMHWRTSNVETITEVKFYSSINLGWFGCFIVFSTTFNNISVISWQSVLLVGETKENQSLTNFITSCCIEYISPWTGFELTILVAQVVLNPATMRSWPRQSL